MTQTMKIPKAKAGRPREDDFPFETMPVGDNFIFDHSTTDNFIRARNACHYYGRKLNRKFSVRTIKKKVTIWRVK